MKISVVLCQKYAYAMINTCTTVYIENTKSEIHLASYLKNAWLSVVDITISYYISMNCNYWWLLVPYRFHRRGL